MSCHFGSDRHPRHNKVNDLSCSAIISTSGHTSNSWAAFLVHERQQAAGWRDAGAMEEGSVPRLGCYLSGHIRSVLSPSQQYPGGVSGVGWRIEDSKVFQHCFWRRLLPIRHWELRSVVRVCSGSRHWTRPSHGSCDTRPKVHHVPPSTSVGRMSIVCTMWQCHGNIHEQCPEQPVLIT